LRSRASLTAARRQHRGVGPGRAGDGFEFGFGQAALASQLVDRCVEGAKERPPCVVRAL